MPAPELFVQSEDLEHFIQQYVATMVDRKVGEYLTRQLRGVVEARLAALRLSDPSFPSLDEQIENVIRGYVEQCLTTRLPELVELETKTTLKRLVGA